LDKANDENIIDYLPLSTHLLGAMYNNSNTSMKIFKHGIEKILKGKYVY